MPQKNHIVKTGWTASMLRYRRFSGSWAWLLHRLTGLALTGYVLLHIYTLTSLQKGADAFQDKMSIYTTPIWIIFAWVLFGLVIFHSLNGVRIVLIDLANGARYHKKLFYGAVAFGVALQLWMAYVLFFGQETHDIFSMIGSIFQ
jgi:succinate dehydrogenase / fumarate reductase, cytochrome b subunit